MPQRTTLPAPDSLGTLRPGEAAKLLGVTVKTVSRYGDQGLVTFDRLPKGHRRYHRASVEALAPERAS